jgi:hypothetical protein
MSEMTVPPVEGRGARERLAARVQEHDDSWAFTVTWGLELVLSIAARPFWLVSVVGVHFVLEYVRQRSGGHAPASAIGEASWEGVRLPMA